MIITRNWLNEWINLGEIGTDEICDTLNKIGLEVSSVTKYRIVENCVVGLVVKKTPHPDAEKLNVCLVEIGDDEPLQIVCGAKNVAEGQLVPVALVGCELPSGLRIEEATLRGVKSCGMICSSQELGYPKTNDGILVLRSNLGELSPGKPLISIPEFKDDAIEIELTPNRGDCLSIYGIARDLAAAYNIKTKVPNILPDDLNQMGIGRVLDLRVENKIDSSLVYKVLYPKEINEDTIIDLRLAMIGSEAKGLIEKYLAYAIHSTGVILRTYKRDIFANSKSENIDKSQPQDNKIEIVVKKDENGFDAVYGKELISRVGIWQSEESKPSDLDDIIVEASFIEPNELGRNGARNAKNNDWALFKALRGSETDLDFGINYLNSLFAKTSKLSVLSGTQRYVKEKTSKQISVDFDDIFAIVGAELNKTEVVSILKNLGFNTAFRTEQNSLVVDIPLFRHDIENIQDICEEIVRMVGIDNICAKPLKFTEKSRINRVCKNFEKKKLYRHKAVAAGFFESVSYIFTDKVKQSKYGFECLDEGLELLNPITNELNTLRTTCAVNLIEAVSRNVKTGAKSVSLFEVGKVFNAKRDEKIIMSFISSGDSESANPSNHGKPSEFNFASFARKIGSVLGEFSITPDKPKENFYSPYEYGIITIGGENIGIIGRVAVEKDFDLGRTYVCEILFDAIPFERKIAKSYSKLPSVSRDLSLLVPKTLSYDDIKACLKERSPKELKDFYPIDIYEDDSLGDKKSLTLRLTFEPEERTFTEEEINNALEQVLNSLLMALKVTIR